LSPDAPIYFTRGHFILQGSFSDPGSFMKNYSRKTIRFGRFNLTLLSREVMIFYAGKEKIYFKRFNLFFTPLSRKTLLVAFTAFVLLLIVLFPPLKNDQGPENYDPVYEDDREKNELLQSERTDYSSPDESQKLEITEHVVRDGENLSVIAKQYGISIDTICGSNNLNSYDFIRAGVHLKIPNKDGIIYRMKEGNNVTAVAKKYNVSLEKILAENSIQNPDFIPVDTTLFIPDAKPQNIIRGFMWPTASKVITCGYGWRRNPFNRSYREFHQGLDIRSRYEWVRSSKYGKVTYTGWLGGYGKTVVIAHPGGWKTLYGHLSRIIVRPGQYVKQGQSVGKSGNTGRSTGPHLHFEIIKNGSHKNPYSYLKSGR